VSDTLSMISCAEERGEKKSSTMRKKVLSHIKEI